MAEAVATRQSAQPQRTDLRRARAPSGHQGALPARAGIDRLQRAVGNRGMHRLLRSGVIQPKLAVGPADDEYEREADRVADEVMRMPDPSGGVPVQRATPRVQRLCSECENEEKEKVQPGVGDQAIQEFVRQGGCSLAGCACGGTCPDCRREAEHAHVGGHPTLVRRSGALVQTRLTVNKAGDAHEHEADRVAGQVVGMSSASSSKPPEIQRVSSPDSSARETTAAEERGVENALQGGQPLSASERAYLEPRFGRDLGDIRIHAGRHADESTRTLNARAYTTGTDIVFNAGEYSPGTTSGMMLLAHEVTHSVQQSGKQGHAQRTIGDGHDLVSLRFALDPVLEACFDNERVLEFGDVGPSVATIQHALVEGGFLLSDFGVDGIFRAETRQAVRDFQTAQGLTGPAVDGRIGPTTMGLFDAAFPTAPAAGPAPIPNLPAPSGTAPTLAATITTPPTPGLCGIMNFVVRWDLSANAGPRGGFIIQDITITWNERDCAGNPVADPAGHVSPLRYWEAWRVAPNSRTVTPVTTDTFQWSPGLATGCTTDAVAFNGVAQFHNNATDLPNHMTAGNAATKAGILQSSTADSNVGGDTSPAIAHTLNFHWTCCLPFFGVCIPSATVLDAHTP